MSLKVRFSPIALQRLIEIEDYIAEDDPMAAERFVEHLVVKAEALGQHPLRGRVVPELPGTTFRELVVRGYRIIYRLGSKYVDVATVFEGHRKLRDDELPPKG